MGKDDGYRIVGLWAENIKKVTVAWIRPDGDMVEISGENGQGKSSVLDAIEMALAGGASVPDVPIRRGAKSGRIQVDLGNGGKTELTIERKFTPSNKNGYLSITTADGMEPQHPQRMLDGLMGTLSLDPRRFLSMKKPDQLDVVRQMAPVAKDIDVLDERAAKLAAERTENNRELKRAIAVEQSIVIPEGLPEAPPDIAEIETRLAGIDEHNTGIRNVERHINALDVDAAECARRVQFAEKTLAEMKLDYDKAQLRFEAAKINLPLPALRDANTVLAELTKAREVQAGFHQKKRREDAIAATRALQGKADTIETELAEISKNKTTLLAEAKMPVEGLSFGAGEVLYMGLPLDQASDAEQLLVSTRMAAALHPKLRVIRIRDGSLLDTKSMQLLTDFASANNLQIWIERVGPGAGIVMEDGHVRGQEDLVAEQQVKERVKEEGSEAIASEDTNGMIAFRNSIKAGVETAPTMHAIGLYRAQAKARLKNFPNALGELNGTFLERERQLTKK